MGKIFIENTEIIIKERDIVEDEEHVINNGKYVNRVSIKKEFESGIYSYKDFEKVLISQISRFGEDYYKIVIFHDENQKAWNLAELSARLEVRVWRMSDENFVIVGDGKGSEKIASQISFCKLKPSTKVEEISINFTEFKKVHFIKKDNVQYVLVCYSDKRDDEVYNTLALYNCNGRCEQSIYEYREGSDITYRYEVNGDKIKVIKTELPSTKN